MSSAAKSVCVFSSEAGPRSCVLGARMFKRVDVGREGLGGSVVGREDEEDSCLKGVVEKKIKGAIESKKGKTKLKNGSKCGLKKTVAQTRQCDQSRN